MERISQPNRTWVMMYWTLSKASLAPGTVIQEQQDPGQHLDHEEKKGDASEEIPVGQAMSGDSLVAERGYEVVPIKSFIKPADEGGEQGHASRFRLTTISSPRTWTSNTSSGLGGGPEMLRPLRS